MDTLLQRLGSEVRENLHQIMGMMELMTEEPLSESQRDYLERCRLSADQLLCAANDLAELTRTDFPEALRETFEVRQAVHEVAWFMGHLAERRQTEFSSELDAELPSLLKGDVRDIQDLLRKVLEAALHAASGGSVRLRTRALGDGALVFEILIQSPVPLP